jgi:citrate lyase subunit beta/citryl-CoA lyase
VVVAGYFGVDDFVADMGGIRTSTGAEVLYARSQVVLAARLAGVPALDQAVSSLRDDALFLRECREARTLGYRGKLCLHPSQVLLANQAFLPSVAETDRARRLLLAYEEAVGMGEAAIDFEGQMVDESLAAQARQLLATADQP